MVVASLVCGTGGCLSPLQLVHQHGGAAEHNFARIRIEEFEQARLSARHQAFDVRDLFVGDVQWKFNCKRPQPSSSTSKVMKSSSIAYLQSSKTGGTLNQSRCGNP